MVPPGMIGDIPFRPVHLVQWRLLTVWHIQNLPLLKATVRSKTVEILFFSFFLPKECYVLMVHYRVSNKEEKNGYGKLYSYNDIKFFICRFQI